MTSGTKLVATLGGLALALGVVSWWYRFESAHRSTNFWGATAAELIARPSEVTSMTLDPATDEDGSELLMLGGTKFQQLDPHEVTHVPGMVHLRNSLLTDSNFDWTQEVKSPRWRWCLRFARNSQEARVLFSEDFTVVGMLEGAQFRAVNCQPMSETLREYFARSRMFVASSGGE